MATAFVFISCGLGHEAEIIAIDGVPVSEIKDVIVEN